MRQPASRYPDSLYDQREEDYMLVGEERPADYQQEYRRRDRRLPAILLTVAVMALFAGGLWFAYVQGTKHAPAAAVQQRDGLPLLRADDRPTKVKPEQPGGMRVPDQNVSLYNEKPGGPSVEKLLPQPEQPMPRPAPPPEPPAPQAAPQPASPAPSAAPPAPPVTAAAKPAAKPAVEPKPPAEAKPAAAPKPAAVAATGKVEVRLASVRTPESAREEWARLKREYADLLGNLRANAVPVDLGEKGTYYRIQAGPFADTAAAERLCAELKKRNHGCILAR